MKRFLKKRILYPLEFLGLVLIYGIGKSLPLKITVIMTGWLARKIGIFFSAFKTARRNLEAAFPENSYERNTQIIEGVLDTFGKTMGDYPHLRKIDIYNDKRFEVIGTEYIDQLRDDNKPAVIFGAHLASWEVAIMAMNQRGLNVTQMYRATNNPYVDWFIGSLQRKIGSKVLTKGRKDGREVIKTLEEGGHLFLLVDQKMNRGIPVPFFCREAMMAPAAARMAMKFDCPLVPARVERLDVFKFRITFYPPLKVVKSGNQNQDLYATMCEMNEHIEQWVRERPEQWLWLHNRWPKEKDIVRRDALNDADRHPELVSGSPSRGREILKQVQDDGSADGAA